MTGYLKQAASQLMCVLSRSQRSDYYAYMLVNINIIRTCEFVLGPHMYLVEIYIINSSA